MANFTKVSHELAKKFICSSHKNYALNQMMYDINHLVYTDNGEPLEYKTKSMIFKEVFELIAGREKLFLKEGENVHPNFVDIIPFFEKRSFILQHLKSGVKQQSVLN